MDYEFLKTILIEKLGIDSDIILPESKIEKDLELDSTDTVVIALEIKKLYGIDFKFADDDMSLAELCKEVTHLCSSVVNV